MTNHLFPTVSVPSSRKSPNFCLRYPTPELWAARTSVSCSKPYMFCALQWSIQQNKSVRPGPCPTQSLPYTQKRTMPAKQTFQASSSVSNTWCTASRCSTFNGGAWLMMFTCLGVATPKHRLLFVQISSDSTPNMCLTKVTASNSDFNLEHGAPASHCLQRCSYRSFSLQGNLLPCRCKSLTSLETLLQRFSRVAGALLWSTSTTIWHCDLKSGLALTRPIMASSPSQDRMQLSHLLTAVSHKLSRCSRHDCTEQCETTSMYVECFSLLLCPEAPTLTSPADSASWFAAGTGGLCNPKTLETSAEEVAPVSVPKISAQKPCSQNCCNGLTSNCCHDLSRALSTLYPIDKVDGTSSARELPGEYPSCKESVKAPPLKSVTEGPNANSKPSVLATFASELMFQLSR